MAHIRQSWPDFGLGFRVKVLQFFKVVPSSLGSGEALREQAQHRQTLDCLRG